MSFSKIIAAIFDTRTPSRSSTQRGAGEPDLGIGQIITIDYDNGYTSYVGRKIRVLFVIEKRDRLLIRAYCFHSTRERWFEAPEISRILDASNKDVLSQNATSFFSDTEKFETR